MRRVTILTSIGLLVAVCVAAAVKGDAHQEPPKYQSVQQHGDVKVTLLKVARITSFDLADANGRANLVPGVDVTYAVEDVSAKPLGQFHMGSVKCFMAGKPAVTMAGVVVGGQGGIKPWSATDPETGLDRPPVASAKRSVLCWEYLRGIVLDRDRVDLHIETGVGGLQTFKFENVPLGTGGR